MTLTSIKKWLSLLLVISMMGALFIGCTSKGADGDAQADAKSNVDPANLDPLSAQAAENIFQEVLDNVETPEYFKNTPTYEYAIQLGYTPEDNTFGQKYFEKKFNVKIKHIRLEGGNRLEQLNLMYATGTIPDLVDGSLGLVTEYTKQGLLAEIPEDLIKKNMPGYYKTLQKYDSGLLSIAKVDGKNMGLPRFSISGGVPRPAAIRQDWLENVGITQLPKTLDELEEAFIKFRNEDPDRNGKKTLTRSQIRVIMAASTGFNPYSALLEPTLLYGWSATGSCSSA
jgi:putative aldouronate transport system substrate-binding protein